jgi:thymidylate synthase
MHLDNFDNIHDAYEQVLSDVYNNPDYTSSPRGMEIRERVNYKFIINHPTSDPIKTHDLKRNETIADYTKKEVELYNSRSNLASDFAKASKFWEKIANPDGTINSGYGYLIWGNPSFGNPNYEYYESEFIPAECGYGMRTPWQWAKDSLLKDKDTRQAFIKFSLPEHHWFGNKDQTCTMHGNFLIRDNKLHLTIVMRSNDVVFGLVYDLPWFCSLIDRMLDDIKNMYPKVKKGTYTHIAHSMHMYSRDKEKVLKMLGIK